MGTVNCGTGGLTGLTVPGHGGFHPNMRHLTAPECLDEEVAKRRLVPYGEKAKRAAEHNRTAGPGPCSRSLRTLDDDGDGICFAGISLLGVDCQWFEAVLKPL